MAALRCAMFVLALTVCTIPMASADTLQFEGVAAFAAGSINPPNPVEGCNKAKRDAEQKAVKAGTKGLSSWDRLSFDSDCSLSTEGKTGLGYFYIFKARGHFIK
ncbi:hypothetical protein ACN429_06635 [Pseudomonas oryzihabitans]|uniref:hypothetical protein n=1 Tax=Pseudomonas oryzihabitans TaxID=47885 RepID=UPI003628BA52